ncbi:glutamate--tRNA ligase [Nakamurella aerolata]|uniref:Glutamate--tRNA ligase n=1 Tax=Nakamurella aerolata TaxID=1656892 RepID=A0A849A5N1_9ACTN|nr:glutamate--tRNA ligase [Nakamurella aerolata]NNG34683.1 glutamate--tRNA ligase [Nakamurella aerolata]
MTHSPERDSVTLPTVPADLPGTVRVRVAPSPTGDPHVGTAYMALFNLAFARNQGGKFLFRLEDTDQNRYTEGSEQQLFDTLHWLGLNWDEGPDIGGPCEPYRQSERLDTYRPFVEQLIADGHAYYCWCTPERLALMRESQRKANRPTGYDRLCYGKTEAERATLPGFTPNPVVRMLVPEDAPTRFADVIRGEVNAPFPDDQVILKADGFPTYHLAVVVDDHLMGITHVVRGEEWISSTPKHLLLYRFLGWPTPQFAHMPLLRNADRSKISKRKNPAARLLWFREQGYLPQALVNFLSLLGYPPIIDTAAGPNGENVVTEREVRSFEEFAEDFDFGKISTVGPIFDMKKLDWLNGVYIRELSTADFVQAVLPYLLADKAFGPDIDSERQVSEPIRERLAALAPLIQTRMTKLTEATDYVRPFFSDAEQLPIADDAKAQLKDSAPQVLSAVTDALAALDEWTAENLEASIRQTVIEGLELKPKVGFTPIRVATSGQRISPPLFESLEILGKDESLRRLRRLAGSL